MHFKMIPVRFNAFSFLHTYKALTENLNLKDIANIVKEGAILNLKKGLISW